jgi:hypothetical protein
MTNVWMPINSCSDIERISVIIFRYLFCIWVQTYTTSKCYDWLRSFKVMFNSCLLLHKIRSIDILLPIE